MTNMVDVIILVIGIYFLLATNSMKVKGRINRFITGRKYDLSIARDVQGVIDYMYKKNLAIGIITMLVAFVHSFYTSRGGSVMVGNIIYLVYLAAYLVYAIFLMKAQREYLEPI